MSFCLVPLAQRLERGSYEPAVAGSIPAWDSIFVGGPGRGLVLDGTSASSERRGHVKCSKFNGTRPQYPTRTTAAVQLELQLAKGKGKGKAKGKGLGKGKARNGSNKAKAGTCLGGV